LKLPVRWFYVFLEEGAKREAIRYLELCQVVAVPQMKEQDSKKVLDRWRTMLDDPLEKFEPKTDYSGIEKLAKSMES